jgi:hypothetical protein
MGACPGLGHRLHAPQLLPLGALCVLLQALAQSCPVLVLVQHLLVHLVDLLPPGRILG